MSLHVESLVLGQLDTNCYFLVDEKSGDCIVVDPADDGTSINQLILEKQWQPRSVILTHGHFDHCLGLLEVQLAWDIPAFLHPADLFLVTRAQASAHHWLGYTPDPVPVPQEKLTDGQTLPVGDYQLTVLHSPGHTPGSVCLVSDEFVITGDTVFKDGVGRTDFSYAKPLQLSASIAMLRESYDGRLGYPGHGEAFYL